MYIKKIKEFEKQQRDNNRKRQMGQRSDFKCQPKKKQTNCAHNDEIVLQFFFL